MNLLKLIAERIRGLNPKVPEVPKVPEIPEVPLNHNFSTGFLMKLAIGLINQLYKSNYKSNDEYFSFSWSIDERFYRATRSGVFFRLSIRWPDVSIDFCQFETYYNIEPSKAYIAIKDCLRVIESNLNQQRKVISATKSNSQLLRQRAEDLEAKRAKLQQLKSVLGTLTE